uniref:G-protein coupled receptors family 1 profile domain-containing protein n=1 Tax=Periophthalmus magnuspinnatus TaxID=409849 RepID=A0A3B4A5C5_9GOBI
MDSFNSALGKNITFVRPPFFIIRGFIGIPNVKYYYVFLFFVFVFSIIGNAFVMLLILMDHNLQTPKYIAVFNLALCDLLQICALVPKLLDLFLFNHNRIAYNDYFCDHGQLLTLGCNDTSPNWVIARLLPVLILWLPLAFILASYIRISIALAKIATKQEKVKAFKTCSAHLSLVAIYFVPILTTFTISSALDPNVRIINLSLTSVVPPLLNPVIYVLQTQEIKDSIKKLIKVKRQKAITLRAVK